jgi:hypothetical protein
VIDFLQNQYTHNQGLPSSQKNTNGSDAWLLALESDLLAQKNDNGYQYMYIPISKASDYKDTGVTANTVDKMIYKNGVFLTKTNPLNLTPSGAGVNITSTGYIAYDLKSLSGAIGGFKDRKIEIEFNSLPDGKNGVNDSDPNPLYRL